MHFPQANVDRLTSHRRRDRYGDFQLTEAVRPALDLPIVPREGYRLATYRDRRNGLEVPVLAASVSRERLFDLFLDLLGPLDEVVDLVLETSHADAGGRHTDLCREHIDRPVLASYLCDFEDLLLNDGCTGLAVIATSEPIEVQFDEHKLLLVYGRDLEPFEHLVRQAGVRRDDRMQLITEADHLHQSHPRHQDAFQQLAFRLGAGEPAEHVSW